MFEKILGKVVTEKKIIIRFIIELINFHKKHICINSLKFDV